MILRGGNTGSQLSLISFLLFFVSFSFSVVTPYDTCIPFRSHPHPHLYYQFIYVSSSLPASVRRMANIVYRFIERRRMVTVVEGCHNAKGKMTSSFLGSPSFGIPTSPASNDAVVLQGLCRKNIYVSTGQHSHSPKFLSFPSRCFKIRREPSENGNSFHHRLSLRVSLAFISALR